MHEDTLVAGGVFGLANGQPANHLARWDGFNWSPVGLGSSAVGPVDALTVYRGDLVAAGGKLVARWSGSSWEMLGSGMDSFVRSLATHDGHLVAGGNFTIAGGTVSAYFARWGCPCPADLNGDNVVDQSDLAILLTDYGCTSGAGSCPGDVDGDGDTDQSDLGAMLQAYGEPCP